MELKDVSNDILGNIMSRLEGTALASVACTGSHLRELARDEAHWRRLCNSTWPSTQLEEARRLISSSVSGGFVEFYGSSYPLIVYDHKATTREIVDGHASPCDLVSLVDVFLNDKLVLSRVLDGIPQAADISDHKDIEIGAPDSESRRWFSSCPFRWDCFDRDCCTDGANGHVTDVCSDFNLPCEDQSAELNQTLRLSWIILDKKSEKAVNLSSWKPISVQRDGPHDADYLALFGCVISVNQRALPHKLGKCVITARFNLGANCIEAGSMYIRELSLEIEDIEGTRVNGEKSLKILNQALSSSRSRNQMKVDEGFRRYEEERRRMLKQKEFTEKLAGRLCVLTEIAAFVTCSYALKFLF